MDSPYVSSTLNFVKQYPITLCGFSLLFMPSVYRLLLYFTPLLVSTAIFLVAMISWGPSMSSGRGKRRGKHNDWPLNGSFKIYDDEEDEDEDEEEEEEEGEGKVEEKTDVSQKGKEEGNAKPDLEMKVEPKLQESDPDYEKEIKPVGTAYNSAISVARAEPDPELHGDGAGAASSKACSAEPDPDLHGERVIATSCSADQPGPSLIALQNVEPAHDQDLSTENHLHAALDLSRLLPEVHDDDHYAEPAPTDPDQPAAGDHLKYHDAEQEHPDHEDAELDIYDYHDAEADPDMNGECGEHAKAEEAQVKNDDHLQAAISELRQNLGMMKRAPYTDDPRDILSHQPAECLQTLQAAA